MAAFRDNQVEVESIKVLVTDLELASTLDGDVVPLEVTKP